MNTLYTALLADAKHCYEANLFEEAYLYAGKALLFAVTEEEITLGKDLYDTCYQCFYHYANLFYCCF